MNYAVILFLLLITACSNNHPLPDTNSNKPVNKDNSILPGGQGLFEANCSACHGADGTAGIANAANLRTIKLNQSELTQSILNGKGAMPSFKSRLTIEEINKLSTYALSLRK